MNIKRGQITVLVLLVSLLALAASLSVASRSLSDLKQTTYLDSGTKALAAAEAGLQYALFNPDKYKADDDCSGTTISHTITGLSLDGVAPNGLSFIYCGIKKDTVTILGVAKDDVAELDLTVSNPSFNSMDVSWRGDASLEIEVVDQDGVIRRYPYNANTSLGQSRLNNFAPSKPGVECGGCNTGASFDSCTGVGEIMYVRGNSNLTAARLVRVKPLYQPTDINFCARTSGNSAPDNFNLTYYRVIVTAKMVDGTVRRIQADRSSASMPAIFDNVIYSGGNISK